MSKRRVVLMFGVLALGATGAVIGFNFFPSPSITTVHHVTVAPAIRPIPPVGLIAAVGTVTTSYRSPSGSSNGLIPPMWHGSPLFLPVIAARGGDLEVRLPTRPNDSTAWIRRAGIRLYRSPYEIVIDLRTRHLLLYRDGAIILDAPAGVGAVNDPTPTGHFFVTSFARAPSAAWGPFVLVTSAHSNAINDWEGSGDAVIAIHGALGDDREIGTAGAQISHGCVRLHDSDLVQLRVVPDGSPVNIIS